ncbi:MAG: DUF4340 domain-containing protein [Planctomycetota bacterium]|nr:DUF4340 domain-containing protein [Planctomycetota bacterium]
MNRLTPLILLVAVMGLGYLALQQARKEAADARSTEVERLFGGVEEGRLRAIRLEFIAGSRHIRMERDAGRWFLTDPMAWPMDQGVLDKFLGVIARNGAEPVSEALAEQVASSFAPPLGFIETTERLGDGSERRVRVEVGALDIDGMRIFVRRDGRVFRTIRNIENLFDFIVADYRSKRLFGLERGSVAQVDRAGGWDHRDAVPPLDMSAQGLGARWGLSSPVRCAGDPVVFTAWTSYLSGMRARRFASDDPEPDLERFGLDQPWVTLRVTNLRGLTQSLHVAAAGGKVYARRDEQPTIYELDDETVPFVCEPLENFIELRLMRLARSQIASVRIQGSAGDLRLTPGVEGWSISRAVGADEWGVEYAVDPLVIKDLLAAVEEAEVTRSFIDLEPDALFPEGGEETLLWVESTGGERFGGRFGATRTLPDGAQVTPYLRLRSGLAQALPAEFGALLERPLEDYLSRSLWSQTNTWLRSLTLEGEERSARFERGDSFDWRMASTEEPARVLDTVLEQLLFLKATDHLPPGGPALELEDPVVVTFTDAERRVHVARVGIRGDEVLVEVGDLRARLRPASLHASLLGILSGQ